MMKRTIAAWLMLVATPLSAQVIDAQSAKEKTIAFRAAHPDDFEKLRAEIAGGLKAQDLVCFSGKAACDAGDLMITPGGQTVKIAAGGVLYPETPPVESTENQTVRKGDTETQPVKNPVAAPETEGENISAPVVQEETDSAFDAPEIVMGGNDKIVYPKNGEIVPEEGGEPPPIIKYTDEGEITPDPVEDIAPDNSDSQELR